MVVIEGRAPTMMALGGLVMGFGALIGLEIISLSTEPFLSLVGEANAFNVGVNGFAE